jgi:CheY-like chemotaxis protein
MADDLDMNRDLVKLLLEHAGHAVAVARDGAEAIESARANSYDLILLDIHMPGVDGVEAVRRIRKLGPGHGDMPIVALTADVTPARLARYERAGFSDHIAKPIDADGLLRFMEARAAQLDADAPVAGRERQDQDRAAV